MTRAISITNLSNWDGEDYEITAQAQLFIMGTATHIGLPEHNMASVTLKPGESVELAIYKESHIEHINVIPCRRTDDDGNIVDEPFYEDDKQVIPHMELSFR